MYHIAAVESGEDVRLSEDYFIEAQKDRRRKSRSRGPGAISAPSPIEEVTVAVEAKDDFGLKSVELHYSVNGGAGEDRAPAANKDAKTAVGQHRARARRFQGGAGRHGEPVRRREGCPRRLATPTCSSSRRSPSSGTTPSPSRMAAGGGGGDDDQATSRTRFPSARKRSSPPPGTSSRARAPGAPTPRTRRSFRRCNRSCATRPSRCPTA